MKSARWESSTGALVALLATREFVFCDLYTVTTVGGGPVLLYATGDVDMAWPDGPGTFDAHGPGFDQSPDSGNRATGHWKTGLDVDTWQVAIMPRAVDPATGTSWPDKIAGVPWLSAIRAGMLDGAEAQVDRAFLPVWPTYPFNQPVTPTAVVTIFAGMVAPLDYGRSQVTLTINSHLELLTASMPRNIVQASCRHALFDQGCTLSAAAFAVSGTAGTASTPRLIATPSLATPGGSGTYERGRILMNSGQNAGFARSVRSWAGGVLSLLAPLPFPVAAGDSFTAYPGCDKTQQNCALFKDFPNFGGFPYVPVPETAS